MRRLVALVVPLVMMLGILLPAMAPGARAKGTTLLLAQEEETEGKGGGGQPAEETGAGEGETEAPEETGPPWTYQMARMSLLILLVLFGAIGLAYYRFVARRRRGEA